MSYGNWRTEEPTHDANVIRGQQLWMIMNILAFLTIKMNILAIVTIMIDILAMVMIMIDIIAMVDDHDDFFSDIF